ncbi:MAG: PIN domain-containing protein [Microcoleus sp. PH2017_29_MFU_D_A]|jgi:PIN domain nuclease of toxin-antitoxin system|uniref:type II toxin-antitoxin system VapC family toxin n=1 Tax=unclassified Microcoleus TaxID=2642155 RepID=UPI001DC2243E|nr:MULTISPECIES: PIN domain-containing protein [unclassified Microcoleus]MCC3604776.1 PIN domain-containing protein [Microcoleus sp. PH2017_29_MFU_D_A]MCC3635701.1 PIN domain-containing protein [Microcoleus sp. PH2017_37_MFU_D_B]
MKYVIVTHALIWFLEGNQRLGTQAQAILSNLDSQLVLPAIALAEAAWIVERGKTSIPSVNALFNVINSDSRITVYPLDRTIVDRTLSLLNINEMHDRQIVATAMILQERGETVALLTCDRNITASGVISIIW